MTSQEEYVKVEVWCGIGLVGCEIKDTMTVDRKEWESMSEEDREDYCRDIAFESFEWGWKEVSEDD